MPDTWNDLWTLLCDVLRSELALVLVHARGCCMLRKVQVGDAARQIRRKTARGTQHDQHAAALDDTARPSSDPRQASKAGILKDADDR